jgi:NAD-dependent SIR2 family protein deacetylase
MSVDPAIVDLLRGARVAVVTGAGVSTASGIPDYRGPETARRARRPIQFAQYVGDPTWRSRYWARSAVGWPRIRDARPNDAHLALRALGWPVITQNVDRLHTKAGSVEPVELHGALAEVICMGCGALRDREDLQRELLARNPHLRFVEAASAPDGDAELIATASVPACACGGFYKPHVVFFGETVPRDRVDAAYAIVGSADVLLVLGTSLTVFSGYRFVKRSADAGRPVVIVNQGPTRGDALATHKVDADVGDVLRGLEQQLVG